MVSAPKGSGLAQRWVQENPKATAALGVPDAKVEHVGNVALPRDFLRLWRGLPLSFESTIHVVLERMLKPIAEDPVCASI